MLKQLRLTQFRNHTQVSIDFDPALTVVVGDNAAGKTNLMEALYMLSTGESFRASRIEEMVAWDAEVGHVVGTISNIQYPIEPISNDKFTNSQIHKSIPNNKYQMVNEEIDELQVTVTRGVVQGKRVSKRLFKFNGTGKRKQDFIGRLPLVLFRPEDLSLVAGSKSERRHFLDAVLIQVDHEYARSLVSYEKALSRRNRLLDAIREGTTSRTALLFWDQLMIKEGNVITAAREALIETINLTPSLSGRLRLTYDKSVISPERLKAYEQQELLVGYTMVGPHKDDFIVFDDSEPKKIRNIATYGSRGEQRMAVLWLKEAQLEYMATRLPHRPLLLLDDIFSELDHAHDMKVVELVKRQQTIVTTTDGAMVTLLAGLGKTIHLPLQ